MYLSPFLQGLGGLAVAKNYYGSDKSSTIHNQAVPATLISSLFKRCHTGYIHKCWKQSLFGWASRSDYLHKLIHDTSRLSPTNITARSLDSSCLRHNATSRSTHAEDSRHAALKYGIGRSPWKPNERPGRQQTRWVVIICTKWRLTIYPESYYVKRATITTVIRKGATTLSLPVWGSRTPIALLTAVPLVTIQPHQSSCVLHLNPITYASMNGAAWVTGGGGKGHL